MSNTKKELIQKMEPKIKKSIRHIPWQYREDVEQEIKMKVMESIDKVNTYDVPSFFEYTAKENDKKAGTRKKKANNKGKTEESGVTNEYEC
ncbi:hypothetical protein MKX54_01510 [Alkalihalobacillus sp. FSL R5-0424]